jgi:hypothetical protein
MSKPTVSRRYSPSWIIPLVVVLGASCSWNSEAPPMIYQVAIGLTPSNTLVLDACFINSRSPSDTVTDIFQQQQWLLWDGPEDMRFLQIGDLSTFPIGEAERVNLNGDTLRGVNDTFTASRKKLDASGQLRTNSVTVEFTQLDYEIGGTLTLSSPCTTCPNKLSNCTVDLPFFGQSLDAYPGVIYSPTGG